MTESDSLDLTEKLVLKKVGLKKNILKQSPTHKTKQCKEYTHLCSNSKVTVVKKRVGWMEWP